MPTLTIKKSANKISVELDRDKLESLMASMGILSAKALENIGRAEEDYRRGRYRILRKPAELLKLSRGKK
ncbi:MAG: hypothetical protein Q8R12_04260 [bacterium]|nr:hypothetical protein [bacterium]